MPPSNNMTIDCPPDEAGTLEGSQETVMMDPSTIRYTQEKISCLFSRRPLQKKESDNGNSNGGSYSEALKSMPTFTITGTLQQLRDETLRVTDIPAIRVVNFGGESYSLDNRRLWVFKEYGKPVPVIIEPVGKEFFQKNTSCSDGLKVNLEDPRDKQGELKENETFLSIVLRWTIRDVMNERMHVNRVVPIAEKFPDLQAYYRAFRLPFLEDTRGKLQHSLEGIGGAPYMSLLVVEEDEAAGGKNEAHARNKQLRKLKITTSGKDFVERDTKDSPWKPKATDLLLLCTLVPESLEDLHTSGVLYTFAMISHSEKHSSAAKEKDDVEHMFKVTAFLPKDCPEQLDIAKGESTWYAVFLDNAATAIRIWAAINPDLFNDEDEIPFHLAPKRPLVQETLYSTEPGKDFSNYVENICNSSEDGERMESTDDGLEAVVEQYCGFRELNTSQTEAVRSTVMGLMNEEGFRVRLIQGPPGTGKTSAVTALVSIISCLKNRLLVCAPTNRAVSEVAERFLLNLRKGLSYSTQFYDFTSASVGVAFCRPLQVGDVLIVGNQDKEDTVGVLGDIFLPSRVDRLLVALAPLSGWRHTAQLLVDFLADPFEEFEMHEQLLRESPEETPPLNFVEFIRDRLRRMGKNMMHNGRVMCNDLPTKVLCASKRKIIAEACNVLGNLLEYLDDQSLTIATVKGWFRTERGSDILSNGGCHGFPSAKQKLFALMRDKPGYVLDRSCRGPPTVVWVEELCLRYACVVFSTTSSAGSFRVRTSGPFDYAVIDEAAQLVEAETAIVTQLRGVDRALLVGDPKQLQALVTSQIAKESWYGRSLFERLQKLGHPCHVLDIQYRMHPAISQFPNRQFYSGAVRDGANVLSEDYRKPYQNLYGAYAFIDIKDGEEERDDQTMSWRNKVEAEVAVYLISKIRGNEQKLRDLNVGVISPYKSQVDHLHKRLNCNSSSASSSTSKHGMGVEVDVKTVDGFQGGEKDVILFSAVRANSRGLIGFVEDERRLNVALTRGRYCVLIIGNSNTLAAENRMWRGLVEDAKTRQCYFDARNDPGLKKTILRVKNELEQFASLLRHDSILFQDTTWKVIFTREFKNTITKIKSTYHRQTIINAILNLAKGRRGSYPTKCCHASDIFSKMIHVQPVAGWTLVWTVDVEKYDQPRQLIKIWDVVESSCVAELVRRLEAGFATYAAGYVDRCSTLKFENMSPKVLVPATWKHDPSFRWYHVSGFARRRGGGRLEEGNPEPHLEKADVEESVLLMKFYPLTSGVARQLLTAVDGSKIELLFEVNEEEAAIIQYPFSSFILGRSGTGKTTVITTRLLQKEQHHRLTVDALSNKGVEGIKMRTCVADKANSQPQGVEYLRQAMITLSPKLCAAIKHHIAKTSRTILASDSSSTENGVDPEDDLMLDEEEELKLMGGIPDTLVNLSPEVYPLVITFRKFLAMVDGSVVCPFLPQENSQLHESLINDRVLHEEPECSSNSEDSAASDSDSLRDEEHVEVDDTEDLEEVDPHGVDDDEDLIADDDEDVVNDDEDLIIEKRTLSKVSRRRGNDPRNCSKRMVEVTFEHFTSCYWPHFSQDLIKHFDSSMVFTEILSFIKGSLEALRTRKGKLSKEHYLALASKKASSFDEQRREAIYRIFLLYERQKSLRGEYDIADYCTHLYTQMRQGQYLGPKFHYLYVDEVQDLTMSQIVLFKYVCDSPEEGFVFAGDTAQTIARGVSFRFQDIRHLFYTEFLERGENHDEKSFHGKRNSGKRSLTPHMPDLHHLSQNFRTHVGIVNIANSIVQLLHHFFPNAVDRLDPESSLIQGDTPVFLEREDNHEFVTNLFGRGGAAGGGGCDFGAEQVILVRDMATKQRMMERLGKRGLVMSVLECKGLEFQDVLLYNFFADSPLESKWRVIYSYLAENGVLEGRAGNQASFPRFHSQKHNLLMSELKQLYVVVTRARQRLWIYDEAPEYHRPILDFWNRAGLIHVKRLDDELIKTIQGKSSPEDWKKRGIQLFNDRQYDLAELSFERAGEADLAKWAKAAGLQQSAERLLASDAKAGARLMREASTLYISLDKGVAAAKCHTKIGDHKRSGMIYQDSCKPPKLEEAGDCFMEAKSWKAAAAAYYEGSCMRKCLAACYRGKLLEQGSDFIFEWERNLVCGTNNTSTGPSLTGTPVPVPACDNFDEFETLKLEYLKRCAVYYYGQRNVESMMKFVRRFPTANSQKVFLKRRDCFDQLLEVEESEGNFIKAAEMAEKKGDVKHAIELLVRAECQAEAVKKILERARFDMFWGNDNPGWPLRLTSETGDLLQRARAIANDCPDVINIELLQEIDILLGPGDGLEHWTMLEDSTNLRLQVIAGRQAMDVLLRRCGAVLASLPASDDRLGALVFELLIIWDSWAPKIMSLIHAIKRAQRRRDTAEDENLLHCSNIYLGVVKSSQPQVFLVTDCSAYWLQKTPVPPLPNQGRRAQMNSGILFSLAEYFWATQLGQVGLDITKIVEFLLFSSTEINDTDFCATSFSAHRFLPKGKLLCKLFSMTDSLTEILSQKAIEDGGLDLRSRLRGYGHMIHSLSFPFSFSPDIRDDVVVFREEVGALYDSLATDIMRGILGRHGETNVPQGHHKIYQSVARLQMLLPYLSKQWVTKHGTEVQDLIPPKSFDWFDLWSASHRIYDGMLEDGRSSCAEWIEVLEKYCGSLRNIHLNCKETIGPFMFVHMLERGVVMECACHPHLHDVILPERFIVNHMTGRNDVPLYTSILNMSCKGHCRNFSTLKFLVRYILDLLNYSNFSLETWFNGFHIDWHSHLPDLILRLLIIVLTVSINVNDRQLVDGIVRTLSSVFHYRSPLLKGLPPGFIAEIEKLFLNSRNPHQDQLRIVFMRAVGAIGTPLVVLKRRGRKVQQWAFNNKLRFITVNRGPPTARQMFSNSYVGKKPVESSFVKLGSIEKTPNFSLECEDWRDSDFITENGLSIGGSAREIVGLLLGNSTQVSPLVESDVQEEELDDEQLDPSPDEWSAGTSAGGLSVTGRFIIPHGHVSIGEGMTIPLHIKSKLLQCVEEARQRLKEELSPTERYQRDTRSSFRALNIQSKEYLEVFLSEACPLKANADMWLQKLEASVQVLKENSNIGMEDTLLDDIADSQEVLQQTAVILDPMNKDHQTENLAGLRLQLEKVGSLLDDQKLKLQSKMRALDRASTQFQKFQGDVNEVDSDVETAYPTEKGKKHGKKKSKKRKKKSR